MASRLSHGTGLLFLWIAMLVFAAANSVIAKLGEVGVHHLIDGRNPISFCNVLFTANLIAGLTLLGIHRKTWNCAQLKHIKLSEWITMLVLALFSGVLGPTLFFLGLMLTEVINVVLVATLEIPLTLLFGWLLLKERPLIGTTIGAILAIIGVGITFWLHQPDAMPMEMQMTMINIGDGPIAYFLVHLPKAGEICVAVGTLILVLSVECSRRFLAAVPLGIFSVVRMIVGAILFFVIVLIMLGWVHFIDIFSPFLWEWMLLYGGVILAGGLYFWHKGLEVTSSSDLAVTNSFTPVAGVIFAFIIVGEIPELGQYIGGGVILLGIVIALIEKLKKERVQTQLHANSKAFTGV